MIRTGQRLLTAILLAATLMVPTMAWAQGGEGAIEGLITDATGAILPGATITADSPALIGGTRTAVADGDGRYRLLRLPVGEYSVKYELQGFNSAAREKVIVNSNFTATINVDMKVGTLEETVTVEGASPVVDVKASTTQTVVTQDEIQALPTARTVFDYTKYLMGASTSVPEVGGTSLISGGGTAIQIHGSNSNDRAYFRDGSRAAAYFGGGDASRVLGNNTAIQEVSYQTSSLPAAVTNGGMLVNIVYKDGGNRFSGSLFGHFGNESMQSTNLDDNLRSLGVRAGSRIQRAWDVDSGFGGPLRKDRLWFYGSTRHYAVTTYLSNAFEPDGSQSYNFQRRNDQFYKGTLQLNKSNRLAVSMSHDGWWQPNRRNGGTPAGTALFFAPEATFIDADINYPTPYNRNINARWTATKGNAWLFEGAYTYMFVGAGWLYQPSVKATDVARLDLATATMYGASATIRGDVTLRKDFVLSATRLFRAGGQHELKVGTQNDWGTYRETRNHNGDLMLTFRNGVPDAAYLFNTPMDTLTNVLNVGFYAQDAWSIASRLTVNAGIRWDRLNTSIPARDVPAGTWVPARSFPAIDDVPNWYSVVPRLGVSYDLTGEGRTVLKGGVSKYMGNELIGVAGLVNPMGYSNNRCNWADTNGDSNAQASELSACAGFAGAVSTRVDPNLSRHYNWEYTAGLQHELMQNVGLSVMFYRRDNRNFRGIRNVAVPESAYTPVTVANPLTGEPLTVYNIQSAFVGKQDNLLTNSDLLDNTYNGVEASVQRRFAAGTFLLAGYHYGKALGFIGNSGGATSRDLNNPNNLLFSDGAIGNDEPHQFKLTGSIALPAKFSVAGSYLAYSGHPRQRSAIITRTLVPSLTNNSITVPVEPNNVNRYPNIQIVDLRVTRPMRFGNIKFSPFLDAMNLSNANTITAQVTTLGSSLNNVSNNMGPRIFKIGANFDF